MAEDKKPPQLAICFKPNSNAGDFIQVPRFWTDALMSPTCAWNSGKQKGRKAPAIPSSFWKYTLVLWRNIAGGNPNREAKLALSQFHVRRAAAVRWTAAYSCSGFFDIQKGSWSNATGENVPTVFTYRAEARREDWQAFISALDYTLHQMRFQIKMKRKAFPAIRYDEWSNTTGFRALLSFHIDKYRRDAGLEPLWRDWLKEMLVRSSKMERPLLSAKQGQLIVNWLPVTKASTRVPLIEGHPVGCRCDSCLAVAEQIENERVMEAYANSDTPHGPF